MQTICKTQLLETIEKVYETSEDCKLETVHFEELESELDLLARYFNRSKTESFFLALVFALNQENDSAITFEHITKYTSCSPMRILLFSKEFTALEKKGILVSHRMRFRLGERKVLTRFSLNDKVIEAILNNQPMPDVSPKKIEDIIDFLEHIYQLGLECQDKEISSYLLFKKANNLIDEHAHFPIIKQVKQFGYEVEEMYLYFYLIWKTISGTSKVNIEMVLEVIYDETAVRIRYLQNLVAGNNILLKDNWVALEKSNFLNDTEIKLTEKSNDFLKKYKLSLFGSKTKNDNVILPKDIALKKLYYNVFEKEQVKTLRTLMENKKFTQTQERLSEKKLPIGIAILLYGSPGTGKTETVKQLAKKTKREIIKVEISQSKSMWFGESEKIIKRIFTDYKEYAKTCERTPILLFNEADAIISKRQDIDARSISKTENTIQNIILEELENFDGILIATTNLVANLDKAFERRFLFKIKFSKPSIAVKAKIWQLKLSYLSQDNCRFLASRFDLSGGEIDNIVRKIEINEILSGEKPRLENLITLCEKEKLEKQSSFIGFSKS